MLTGKQKTFFYVLKHTIYHQYSKWEKGGVNDEMTKQIREALEVRELIKVRILDNCEEDKHEVAEALAKGAHAELVQLIGLTVVLYKESRNQKKDCITKSNEIR
ncbi:ribosome assembly RNA-binding protein YhbY [Lysinibacillus sp. MHQ-1]|nr:ribosome assembly RNA-binding protein YhbY [Lysinibacillus sp. MHQ-1]